MFGLDSSRRDAVVQGLLLVGDEIICLHASKTTKQWLVTATNPAGATLWEYPLPPGYYTGIGTADAGDAILVHAVTCNIDGSRRQNCILRLNAKTGATVLLGLADVTGSTAGMTFAGDSFLVRSAKATLEIWRADTTVSLIGTVDLGFAKGLANLDVISSRVLALTAKDGTMISTIGLPSCEVRRAPITSPLVTAARSKYEQLAAGLQIASGGNRPVLTVLGVTGRDYTEGLVDALLLPVRVNEPTPLVRIDSTGAVSEAGLYDIKHNLVPVKILSTRAELGVVYGDRSIRWYPLT